MTTTVLIPTVTYAVKAGKALTRINIQSKLVKTVSGDTDGCQYALEISECDIYDAVYEFKKLGIPYRISKQ